MNWSNEWSAPRETRVITLMKEVPRQVPAIVVGDLAVHCGHEVNWFVTHLPTMTKFDKALPSGSRDEKDLIAWCDKVQKEYLANWEYLAGLTKDNYSNIIHDDVVLVIRDWCKSVPIGDSTWR